MVRGENVGVAAQERATMRALALGTIALCALWLPSPLAAQESPGSAETAPAETAPSETAPSETASAPVSEPGPADLDEARRRLRDAETLFDEGNHEGALAELQRTLELIGAHPIRFRVYFNVARSLEALFRYDEAMTYYERFLDEGGAETEHAAEVRAKVEVLRSLLAVVALSVAGPRSYEVWVDGRFVGVDLARVRVPGGGHTLEIQADGYVSARAAVQLAARSVERLELELEPVSDLHALSPTLVYVGVGLTVAAIIGGSVLGGLALARDSQLEDDAAGPGALALATPDAQREIQNLALGADVLFGAAALFGVTTVVLIFFTDFDGDDDEAETAALRLAPAIAPGLVGLGLEGSF